MSPLRATFPAHLILLGLIARKFGENYKSESSSLWSLLYSPHSSSFLRPLKKHLGGHRYQILSKSRKLSYSGSFGRAQSPVLNAHVLREDVVSNADPSGWLHGKVHHCSVFLFKKLLWKNDCWITKCSLYILISYRLKCICKALMTDRGYYTQISVLFTRLGSIMS